MNGNVKAKELDESRVVAKAKKSGQIMRVVFAGIDAGQLSFCKDIAVDATGNVWELGDPIIEKGIRDCTEDRAETYKSMASSKVGPQ